MYRGLNFRPINESDTEEVLLLLARSFCAHDPLEVVLGITETEFIEMSRLDLPQLFQDGLSLIARHGKTNELIGVMTALDATTAFTESTGKVTPKFAPIASMVNRLHEPYMEKLLKVRGYTAYLYMAAVSSEWQGRGVAKSLLKAVEELLISKHYRCAFGVCTNLGSYTALRKNGYQAISSIAYSDFLYDNEKVFAAIQDHPGLTLMEKHFG